MHCDDVRTILLDHGWDADERARIAALLRHVETCDACRAAFSDFDLLRASLRPVTGAGAGAEGADAPAPPQGWDPFLEKLAPATPAPSSLRLRPRPSGGRAAALAASILLAALAFQFGRRMGASAPVAEGPRVVPSTTGSQSDARPEDAFLASLTPSPADAARQADAFERVSDVFDRKASWLMTSAGGTSDVGLAPEPVPAGRSLLMLRLALLHGGAVASDADVVIVPGQSATLALPTSDGGALNYRIGTSAGEPTALTLWLEVRSPQGGEALAALATNLLVKPGERVSAGELVTTAGKYELKVGFTRTRAVPAPAPGSADAPAAGGAGGRP